MRTIPEIESLEIEFKSDLKCYPDHDLIEEIVGMANSAGGFLFLGVEDDGVITGVHKKHKDAIGVTALIANSTVPPISVRAEIIMEENKEVLKIEVPRSRGVVSVASGKILRRRLKVDGSPEVVPMYSYEIPSRLAELGMLDYSAQPLTGATLDDLDPNQRTRLRRIIQNRQGGEKSLLTLPDEELDMALRLITNVAGNYVPTVTGMLLIGKEERIAELIPAARSAFQVLEGTTVRMNEESNKPLLEIFENYETYVKAWNPERETEYGLFRVPIPEFDWAAFREGLVNAFCHRDYTILGAVRVLIDDEGLIISNPGGFIDGVNLKNLLTVEPHGRNPALADVMKRIGLAEKTGRGIDRIYEGSIIYGKPWPDYSESTSRNVKLFIQRAKADLPFAKFIADEQNKQGKPLSIYALMILSVLRSEGRCTLEQIAEISNLSEKKVRSAMVGMTELGLIEASGKGKNRVYIIRKKVDWKSREASQYDCQTDIDSIRYPELVMKLANTQNGIVTKQDVVELLNVTPEQAYTVIKKLKEEGRLELLCGGRYSKYKVVEF
ncbi:MAG: putative DNA binding domain-containing protein [Lachnospiraceae bacterium]|nr:putative DNA binding domain-containing protein [Lachnospiraceae bacterium]